MKNSFKILSVIFSYETLPPVDADIITIRMMIKRITPNTNPIIRSNFLSIFLILSVIILPGKMLNFLDGDKIMEEMYG